MILFQFETWRYIFLTLFLSVLLFVIVFSMIASLNASENHFEEAEKYSTINSILSAIVLGILFSGIIIYLVYTKCTVSGRQYTKLIVSLIEDFKKNIV